MHRSGTSALAGLLVRLGVEGPRTLMPPNDFNPLGHWESEPVAAFNDRLLASAGTSWDAWTAIDDAWETSVAATELASELAALLSREFGSAPTFVVKDPRICRVVPFWLRHLEASGIEPVPIITLRNPADVADSLANRDGLPRPFALLMWLRHMLEAERWTRGHRRTVVRYPDLLEDGHRVAEEIAAATGLAWPIVPSRSDQAIAQFLRRDLCHHASERADAGMEAPLSDWLRRAWDGLSAIASDPRDSTKAQETLDDVREALNRSASLFGNSDEWRRQRLRHALVQAEVRQTDLLRHATAIERDRNTLRDHAAALELDRNAWRDHATALELDRNVWRDQAASLEADRDGHRERANTLETQLPVLLERATTLAGDVQRLSVEVATMERERTHLQEHVGQLENSQANLVHDLAAARQHVAALLQSGSWRVTAPLRAVVRVARRLTATATNRPQA